MSNQQVSIQFPDGKQAMFAKGVSLTKIAKAISPGLAKKAVVGSVNGTTYDLTRPILTDAQIAIHDADSAKGLEVIRHSTAHLLAQAVKRLYPDAHFGVGPVIENGFYYDIEMAHTLVPEDLLLIEREMRKIVAEDLAIYRKEVSREAATKLFAHDPLKQELLEAIPEDEMVTIYEQGDFYDLCRGPHVPSTRKLQHFKLMNISGAYWRGDSNNQMLQRIYGVAFASMKEMEEHFEFLEEAEKRNHRKLGKELELFMFSEEAPGMPFYLANGQIIRNELESFLRNLQTTYDYKEVRTPLMMNQRLWEQSGHWHHYKENMYFTQVDEQKFALKPMNCPGHMLIYKNDLHSYRDLPIRMAEFGQVHRHEFSGALNGLLRVRTFCQDDAHIFVTPKQIEDEITLALKIIDHVYKVFGFEYEIELSTRPEDYMGDLSLWNEAERALENVLSNLGYLFKINEGDGAFYGPKIDIHIKDAIKRSHQCATVQLDFQLPEKFDLTYINEENEKVRPVVIHRAVFGSIDRFLGILIEHFGGAFPLWLAPKQVEVIGVSEVHKQYAEEVYLHLQKAGIRASIDGRNEKLGRKIRDAQLKKTPYQLIIGDQEIQDQTVTVRGYRKEHQQTISLEAFKRELLQEIAEKRLPEPI
ncbi:threonine--tRNA ligase [Ureibacillus sinduriensis]|uniref:Threonine--tRNA ligase n=1 Tax=Ureibacillus sinduriensis BLB-1 = JCM 15800 TaxID=1384057 RepID=A0A0A3IMN7_9BACL|nr:threonine--tRNA ligase [Ureibacillus sinduriensis]KGR76102.1 threonine--tRNA ligase [Ureibacillus sinduriensis BLB-1 = JCM 15800]